MARRKLWVKPGTVKREMPLHEYRAKAMEYVAQIVTLQSTGNMDDLAYSMYLRHYYFGPEGNISYTYSGRTWRQREGKRSFPLSQEEYNRYMER